MTPRSQPGAHTRTHTWSWAPYLAPMFVGFIAIVLLPFGANVYFSFFTWQGGRADMSFQGLENYASLLSDPLFWQSLKNSLYMIVGIVVIPTAIGLLLAAVMFDYLGRHFGPGIVSTLRAMFYLPQILPIAVAGVLWGWILDARTGVINALLAHVGMAPSSLPDWLGNPKIAIYSLLFVLMWLQIGYPVVIFMSGLQRVDPELYEAAELDGAGWFRRFSAITVPQIRPDLFIVVLTATVGALKVFAPVMILTQGGPESSTYVPSYYSYVNFFEYSRVGYGAAVSTVMSLAILAVASLLFLWQRKTVEA